LMSLKVKPDQSCELENGGEAAEVRV
jgi:hypothetical protein